ncbi:glycosyltransferase family 2 protein [Mesonia aquimarina]|uniref:glycosyltransferase family 2 protein n=1 Tax=Mesonia aquimarina TaxID=1504967 RepID=UPI000EF56164|nr:glycosyltransferase family A protein [Mesonia aquimarina]
MPKFSVIISVYNKEDYIAQTLTSVFAQKIKDFEIVIVNDGSTDESEKIIKSFNSDKIKYFSQENKGASAGRNRAMKEAQGQYLALLDADDIWHEIHLQEISSLINEFPSALVFSTALEIHDKQGKYKANYNGVPDTKNHQLLDFLKHSYGAPILSGSTTVFNHTVPKKIGFFDERIISGQDTDYWIRIGLRYKIAFSTTVTSSYTFVEGSLSQKKFQFKNKTDFSKFDEIAKNNFPLEKYIIINRFSLYLKCMIVKDYKNAKLLKKKINPNLLSKKQVMLLKLSSTQLITLYRLKELLKKFNIRLTAFEK